MEVSLRTFRRTESIKPSIGGGVMKKNMGSTDKLLRVLFALVFAVLIAVKFVGGTLAWVFGLIAVMFAATAALGFCPLYVPLGITTCPSKKKE
jgi:hypothetical protein